MVLCDGEVVKGEGLLDESSLTGESLPVSKSVGSLVSAGAIMQQGYLEGEGWMLNVIFVQHVFILQLINRI